MPLLVNKKGYPAKSTLFDTPLCLFVAPIPPGFVDRCIKSHTINCQQSVLIQNSMMRLSFIAITMPNQIGFFTNLRHSYQHSTTILYLLQFFRHIFASAKACFPQTYYRITFLKYALKYRHRRHLTFFSRQHHNSFFKTINSRKPEILRPTGVLR